MFVQRRPAPPVAAKTLISRRHLLAGASVAFAGLDGPGLRDIAPGSGVLYGAAVEARHVATPEYAGLARAIARECGILVPEGALKWRALRPAPDRFDFQAGDTILTFASGHGQRVRGHTLVWHQALPDWFAAVAGPANAGSLLAKHIETVCGHYAGRLQAWDVVNEVVDPRAPDGIRDTPWRRFLGTGYIAAAFRLARAADPTAFLFINDYGMEPDTLVAREKRRAMLGVLHRLLDAGAPVQGLGVQAHLVAGDRFAGFADFLGQVRALGLRVAITELDVSDERLAGTPLAARDAAVAATYASFLHEALAVPALVHEILTWGLTDATSWLQGYNPRPDRLPQRPLPRDSALARKPAWAAIRAALQTAATR
jgi:endo-1,4-beta-xylanase